MQVVLVMLKSDGQRRSFPLNREMTVIGRGEDCDLRVPVGDVSRKHCRLVKEDAGLRIEDLGSSNGTFHNGQRVSEAYLAAGDHLKIGPLQFIVQIDGVPAEDEISLPPESEPTPASRSKAAPSGDDDAFDPMSALLDESADSGVELDLGGNPDDSSAGEDGV
ncbi:MAG TPA: FHA domain-containing protein [Tepidisphaeraceae bacterium]|jgi:pSer/pThr/pTyr-binding forkhead associated (FHA) protein